MPNSTPSAKRSDWLVFLLVFFWKAVLLAFSQQPVPANDAFFYDGAVVHYLLHGGYFNPSIALAVPVSGTSVFCAYPPLYQGVLLAWMSVFGVSALSAMSLHVTLFGVYLLILLAIFRRLKTPPVCVNLAGLFLLILTFHDRPDSLSQVLGMASVYAWIRSRKTLGDNDSDTPAGRWVWLMVSLNFLTLCTSIQTWAFYFVFLWAGMLAAALFAEEKFPLGPMTVMSLAPPAAVLLFKTSFPHLWAGFLEHARETPSLTGLRFPHLDDFLKAGRYAPGILLVAVLLPWTRLKKDRASGAPGDSRREIILLPALVSSLGVIAASLSFWDANAVGLCANLQPLVVGVYLDWLGLAGASGRGLRAQLACFWIAAALGAVRAAGMTTWGVACAADVSYFTAIHRVGEELDHCPPGSTVALSSAYLYEAALHPGLREIHTDWMAPAKPREPSPSLQALVALRPARMILTQMDYYRRFEPLVEQARKDLQLEGVTITNLARVRAPDSFKSLQKVVQHISWAPVIISFSWRDPPK